MKNQESVVGRLAAALAVFIVVGLFAIPAHGQFAEEIDAAPGQEVPIGEIAGEPRAPDNSTESWPAALPRDYELPVMRAPEAATEMLQEADEEPAAESDFESDEYTPD
jgi:hypothetical protein